RMSYSVIGEAQVTVDIDGITALRLDIMRNSRSGRALEEVLHLHLRSLHRVGVLQSEEFLEVATRAPFGEVPLCAGGDVGLLQGLAKQIQVLREIVGVKGAEAGCKIIRGGIG